jgi:hypothetical protein
MRKNKRKNLTDNSMELARVPEEWYRSNSTEENDAEKSSEPPM